MAEDLAMKVYMRKIKMYGLNAMLEAFGEDLVLKS